MWSIEAILLVIISFLLLVARFMHAYDMYFRITYAKTQMEIQQIEAEKFQEFEKQAKEEEKKLEKAMKSEKMSEIGKIGGLAMQNKSLEKNFYDDIMDNPGIEVAMAALEEFVPSVYEKVKKKPHLIPKALEMLKQFQGSGGGGMSISKSSMASNGNSMYK